MIRIATLNDLESLLPLCQRVDEKEGLEHIKECIQTPFLKTYVLQEDAIISYLVVREEEGEYEIDEIATLPSYEGKGYATKLLQHFFTSLPSNTNIYLEVRSKNERAIALYEKMGFVYYRTRKNYYNDDDALCYKKVIQ